jgi:peptidoglycan/xylan/chitin deacetylase (PgdA/CDA1 family)
MSGRPRRTRRLLVAVLLAGGALIATPAAQAAPSSPLPEGPWPPSEVLAADPATVHPPRVEAQAAAACAPVGYGVNRTAPGGGKTVALTFDDGPGVSTDAILRILRDAQVTATFFNIGVNQAVRPALVQAEAAGGFLLGNHTWSHPDLTTLSASAQAAQMDQATAEQVSLVGSPPCFFRPPYGSYNSSTLSLAQARNLSVWNWSVDTEDWKANGSGAATWVNRIISLAQAGGSQTHPVVLMHNSPAGNPATVAGLPTIIKFYRDRGYTFVDLAGRVAARPPFGAFDSVLADGTWGVAVRGWAIDRDTPTQPVQVHVYVDGRGVASVPANGSRPDVARVYPWAGPLHGFSTRVPVAPGAHTVCVYAIDTTTSGVHPSLGCRSLTVPQRPPFGAYDAAQPDGAGGVAVHGWAIDPDTPTQPVRVHIYVDGRGVASIAADLSRPDVARVYPWAGPLHGFSARVPAAPGAHTVCLYAIDTTASGVHPSLGCRPVTVP